MYQTKSQKIYTGGSQKVKKFRVILKKRGALGFEKPKREFAYTVCRRHNTSALYL